MARFRVFRNGVLVEEGDVPGTQSLHDSSTSRSLTTVPTRSADAVRPIPKKRELRSTPKTKPTPKPKSTHQDKAVVCPDCGKAYTRSGDLNRHKKSTGCGGYPTTDYTCQRCGDVFHRSECCKQHIRTCGMGLKPGRPVGSKSKKSGKSQRRHM